MTDEALKYCMRGIVQYLNGNVVKFNKLINKAMKIHKGTLCECGKALVQCRYGRKSAKLCTSCGKVWINGEVVKKCIVGRKIA